MRQADVYLDDILESISRIEEYVAGRTEDDFREDAMLQDSVIRRLEIIGEAVKNIPPEMKKRYPEVDWKVIAGARDIFAHAYFRVNPKRVWRVVAEDLPNLKAQIRRILHEK